MGFRVKPKECASKGIRRIPRRQVEKAICDLSEPAENPDETIHDVRKRLKRIRALLRVVRPAVGKKRYHRQNHLLRDVGRSLSEA
ncbi:MAG TPA: CHAD domain-containing protein, partial [Isosphaeraceae bacterium]|nr:CHAD domain-containing protein [Isosphaeraceae bacterium]